MMSAQTNRQVQAYFAYDSKKSGGYTVSHLRIGAAPIRAPYLIGQADFLACHQPTLMNLDVVAQSVKPDGTVLLNLPDGMEIPVRQGKMRVYRQGQVRHIVVDTDGEVLSSFHRVQRIEHGLDHCGCELFAAQPVPSSLTVSARAMKSSGSRHLMRMNYADCCRGRKSSSSGRAP